jgi:hypothetical protein
MSFKSPQLPFAVSLSGRVKATQTPGGGDHNMAVKPLGMRRILLCIGGALCAIALSAWFNTGRAQQTPEDPKIAAYRQLLSEANERLASALGAYNALSAKNAQTEAELAKLKTEAPTEKKKD